MTVRCELFNYANDKSPLENPKVIIEDDGPLNNQVRISIGEVFAVISITQMEKALLACANVPK